MEQGHSYTCDAFRLEPPPGGFWRGDVRMASTCARRMIKNACRDAIAKDSKTMPSLPSGHVCFVCPYLPYSSSACLRAERTSGGASQRHWPAATK